LLLFVCCASLISNNLDDVEAEFERIQISYNILSEKKTRMQYDRHEVIDDPAAAVQRAVMGAAVSGVVSIGKGIFSIGSSAFDHVMGDEGEIKK
jgi:DnaJ-class molecular chaperone